MHTNTVIPTQVGTHASFSNLSASGVRGTRHTANQPAKMLKLAWVPAFAGMTFVM